MMNEWLWPTVYTSWVHPTIESVFDSDVTLYSKENLQERNETQEVALYAPGFLSIGDDSGGNVFLMELRLAATQVWIVDAGSMTPDCFVLIASNFEAWVALGCPLPNVPDTATVCDLVLVDLPVGGVADILKIKRVFGLKLTAAELLAGTRDLPFLLASRYPNGKAQVLIDRLGEIGKVLMRREIGSD